MCDVERGIALVGVSEEPILMGIHDATMVRLYKTRYPVWFYIIFILPNDIIVEYMTDLFYRNSLLLQNAHQIYSV